MRSFEGSWFAPFAGLVVAVVLAGGCGGSVVLPAQGDAGLGGDAAPGWQLVVAPATDEPAATIAAHHAQHVCAGVEGCPTTVTPEPPQVPDSADVPAVPAIDHERCAAAADCVSGRCVRGMCTDGRTGDACDRREDCDTFCNLATHRCGDFCVDPLACR